MIFYASLILTGLLVLALVFVRLKKKARIGLLVIVILSVSILVVVRMGKGYIPFPKGLRRMVHLVMPPENLYEPIVKDHYLFYKKGFTQTYSLYPKFLALYNLGFLVESGHLPAEYKFSGRLKVEFFWRNQILSSKEISSFISASYVDNDSTHFSGVRLLCFEIPFLGKYEDDLSLRLTVLKPDENLEQYGKSIMLFIGVGSLE